MSEIVEHRPLVESRPSRPSRPSPEALVSGLLFAAIAGVAVAAWVIIGQGGLDYYQAPLAVRGYAKAHKLLRPSGPVGNVLGIAGTVIMLSTLFYVVRKRSKRLARTGTMKGWLEVHIFCGVFGPILITLHTSFKFNGIISVAYWSMVLVVLSGFVGRYLFLRIPKTLSGKELTRAELEERARELRTQFDGTPIPSNVLRRIDDLEAWIAQRESESRSFVAILSDGLAARRRMSAIRRDVRRSGLDAAVLHDSLDLLEERMTLLHRIARLKRTKQLFHLWHVFHRPLVWVMFTILVVHVGVAIYFGYTMFGR